MELYRPRAALPEASEAQDAPDSLQASPEW